MAAPSSNQSTDTSPANEQAHHASNQGGVPPSLVRRSSFEPMRLGLSSLPPPVFSRAPPGQRSVPAIEFLNNRDSTAAPPPANTTAGTAASTAGALPPVIASGANTPGAGLGNGSMTTEPWNLWSDSTAPSNASTLASIDSKPANIQDLTVQQQQSSSSDIAAPSREDSELASALAASVVLDSKADKRSSIASRVSNSSASRGAINASGENPSVAAATTATSWPGELAADPSKALQPQTFALDPSASPERRRGDGNVGDLSIGKMGSSTIPRNVSFSSMLDLPQPEAVNAGGVGLERAASLTRRVTSTGQNALSSNLPPLPAGMAVNDSMSLPSLSFSNSSSGAVPGSYNTPSNSYGSTLRQGGNNSPTQSKTYGVGIPPYGAPFGNADEYGSRARQSTNASTAGYSDFSSTTSVPFGTFGRGIGGFNNDGFNVQNDGNAPPPFGNGMLGPAGPFAPRRDSGYGPSIYNNSPNVGFGNFGEDRRGSRSASWQTGGSQFGGPPMNREMPPHLYSPQGPRNPYSSSFNLGNGDGSFISLNSSSGNNSSQNSIMRYPSPGGFGGLDFLGNASSPPLSNYSLGFGGPPAPASPYMRYPSSNGFAPPQHYMLDGGNYDRSRLYEEKNRPVRSPLLEEFRADKLKRWGVRDMHNHVAEFMCDQVGSRYIQESILEHPTSEDCDLIFNEVHHLILQLATDVFANFCIQKLLEKASTEQIAVMAENLKGNIMRLSLQTYGCRVVQKALEVVSPEHQVMILRELEGAVQKCVRDQNANHVIQKIVTTCPPDLLQFVVDAFHGNIYTFATHPYSCRVLQRILENCPERMTRPLLEELKSYALNLMQDQYGNYVIQFCLEKGMPQDKSDIICQIQGQVLHFSKHKFASNVIEKCIMNANEHEINMIAAEVLAPGLDGNTGIQAMLRHEYANYPLQRLVAHTTGTLHIAIVDQVSMQLAMFREMSPPFNAKHLVAVEKLLVDLAPTEFPGLMRRRYDDHYITRTR